MAQRPVPIISENTIRKLFGIYNLDNEYFGKNCRTHENVIGWEKQNSN